MAFRYRLVFYEWFLISTFIYQLSVRPLKDLLHNWFRNYATVELKPCQNQSWGKERESPGRKRLPKLFQLFEFCKKEKGMVDFTPTICSPV
jgi:hypothetical protein